MRFVLLFSVLLFGCRLVWLVVVRFRLVMILSSVCDCALGLGMVRYDIFFLGAYPLMADTRLFV